MSRPIVGVTPKFSGGRVRVTLPLINATFDAIVEGGIFLVTEGLVTTMYGWPTPGPACQVLGVSRNACPLEGPPALSCTKPIAKNVTLEDVQHYRGPVRVERIVPGFYMNRLVEPKTFTKIWDTLTLVY